MKNKNLHKNQPHAQALSDDDLENVAGGIKVIDNYTFKLSPAEIGIIRFAGYRVYSSENDDNTYSVSTPNPYPHKVCARDVKQILNFKRRYGDGQIYNQ